MFVKISTNVLLPRISGLLKAKILPCNMLREMNQKRQPCRVCKHKPCFKHYCKSCSRWFCPVCVRPGFHPCDQIADGAAVGAMPSTTEAPSVMQDAVDHTELQPGTRVLVCYKPIGRIEIDCKLRQLVYERIILWRVEGSLFVATPDFDLCIGQGEWWSEFWLLRDGRYPHCSHDFGSSVVHHFYIAFNVWALTELVSVGPAKAQELCRKH